MSIIRIGLAETKNFAEGYDAIFGKPKEKEAKVEPQTDTEGPTEKKKAIAAKPKKK